MRVLAAVALALFSHLAFAQAFPSRPLRIVLPYTTGGPTDFVSRVTAEAVSKRIGQPILIDSRPGANERVGTAHSIGSPPDGYTIAFVSVPSATNPSLFELPYNLLKDLQGLIHLTDSPPVISVNPERGPHTFGDFIKLAKEKPGHVTFGSAGTATATHLTVELLGLLAGVQLQHVPFKGDAPSLTELMGGRITASTSTLAGALPHLRGGKIKAIGIGSRERSPLLPEVPTFYEQGYTDAVVLTYFGLMMHAQTPRDIVQRLNAEFNAALQQPEVREKFAPLGLILVGGTPEQFTNHIRAQTDRWAKVIKERNIKVE